MKDRVTILNSQEESEPKPLTTRLSVTIICAFAAAILATVAANNIWAGSKWLSVLNEILIFVAPVAMVFTILFAVPVFFKAKKSVDRDRIVYSDRIARDIAWSAVRPEVVGDSRNCAISRSSTATKLHFYPILLTRYMGFLTLIAIIFLVAWLQIFGGEVLYQEDSPSVPIYVKLFAYAFALMLCTILFKSAIRPLRAPIFDKNKGVFWIKNRRIFGISAGESEQTPISEIYALQILSYTDKEIHMHYREQLKAKGIHSTYSSSNNRRTYEYEVNAVLKNNKRVNIINHRNRRTIYADAKELSRFLGVPVWDRDTDVEAAYQKARAKA